MKVNIITEAIARENQYQAERRADWRLVKEALRKMNANLFPANTKIYPSTNTITIRVPWGVDNLRQARIAMGDGWTFSSNYQETGGSLTKSYYWRGPVDPITLNAAYIGLSLIMDASELDENTCKRIEVGEKTFTQKVYKVICSGEVSEMLGKAEEFDEVEVE